MRRRHFALNICLFLGIVCIEKIVRNLWVVVIFVVSTVILLKCRWTGGKFRKLIASVIVDTRTSHRAKPWRDTRRARNRRLQLIRTFVRAGKSRPVTASAVPDQFPHSTSPHSVNIPFQRRMQPDKNVSTAVSETGAQIVMNQKTRRHKNYRGECKSSSGATEKASRNLHLDCEDNVVNEKRSPDFSKFVAEYCQIIRNIRDYYLFESERQMKHLILKPSEQIPTLTTNIKREYDNIVKYHCRRLYQLYVVAKNSGVYNVHTLRNYEWCDSKRAFRIQKTQPQGQGNSENFATSSRLYNFKNKGDAQDTTKYSTVQVSRVSPEKPRHTFLGRDCGDKADRIGTPTPESPPDVWTGWNQHYVDDMIDKGTPGRRGPRPKARAKTPDNANQERVKKRWPRKLNNFGKKTDQCMHKRK